MVYFYSCIRYKLFVSYIPNGTSSLYDVRQNTCWGGVLASLDTCQNKTIFLLPSFTSLLKQTAQSFVTFPSCARIRLSLAFRLSSATGQLGLPLFRVILFRTFPVNPSATSLGETKLEVLLTAGSCFSGYCTYISVTFSSHFLQSCTKNSIKCRV
jgi:hypothetical protein